MLMTHVLTGRNDPNGYCNASVHFNRRVYMHMHADVWEKFYADISGMSVHIDDEDPSPCMGLIEVGLTGGGWAWLMGCAVSFVLWFGYLYVWVGLPRLCIVGLKTRPRRLQVEVEDEQLLTDERGDCERADMCVSRTGGSKKATTVKNKAKVKKIASSKKSTVAYSKVQVQVADEDSFDADRDQVETSEVETMV